MDGAPVFDRIATELRRKVPDTSPTLSVVIETAPGEARSFDLLARSPKRYHGMLARARNGWLGYATSMSSSHQPGAPARARGPKTLAGASGWYGACATQA